MTDKRKTGWYIDISLLARLQNLAVEKGCSVSNLVEKYIKNGLSTEPNLTISERIFHQIGVLNCNIDGLLSTMNVKVEGSIEHKLMILGAIFNRNTRVQTEREKNKQVIYSLVSIINELKDLDKVKYDDCMRILHKYPIIMKEIKKWGL